MGAPGSVIIVGGGPAGALLAFLMARGGVPTTLIERHSDFSREFRGEGMSPSGMAAIREAGLWDEFDRLPWTPLKSIAMYSDGRPFLSLDIDSVLPPGMEFIRVLGQPHLLELLVREAGRFTNFSFRRGVLVREPILQDGRVVGVRIAGEGGTDENLHADYVIGADGRYSTLRKRLGLELGGEAQVFDVVWCKVPRPRTMDKGRVYSFLLDEFFGLAFPTENDEVQVGRIIAKGSFKAFRGEEGGEWYDKIAASLPPDIAPGFLEVRAAGAHPALLDVVCGSLPTWSAPGICFVGDAAHPMSPIGAQGINVALRDAVVAANHFGPLLAGDADARALDAAAAAFEAERRTEVDKLQAQQTDAPKRLAVGRKFAAVLRAVPDSWVAWFARWILGLRSTRNFIQGVSDLKLTFGKPRA
jgi:2-polyprenyl-6-methoxyphenol hydroxylase-like FAD-dependent oxidoreductase